MEKVFHPANTRGKADFGWLKANYSFSFANYFNPKRIQFGKLRVLNDDSIAGGMGFGTHPHRDMEIITIPLEGAIRHKDSMNYSETIKAGEVQVMSASTGVEHSEINADKNKELNLLQIWIIPEKTGIEPKYKQKDFSEKLQRNQLLNIVSPQNNKNNGALPIHQQAFLHLGKFDKDEKTEYEIKKSGHGVYIFLIEGEAEVAEENLQKRDAIGVWNTERINIEFRKSSQVLLIEVPLK